MLKYSVRLIVLTFGLFFIMAFFFSETTFSQEEDSCSDECTTWDQCYEEYCAGLEDPDNCTAVCATVYEDCDDDPYTPLEAYKRCVYTQDNPDQDGYQCADMDWCPWGECTWDEMGQDYFQTRFCVL